MKYLFVLSLLTAACSPGASSQNNNRVGIVLRSDYQFKNVQSLPYESTKMYQSYYNLVPGLFYERLLGKKSGVGIEFSYTQAYNQYSFPVAAGSNNSTFVTLQGRESYLQIPLQYKYHSRLLNISAGPTLEYFLGWKSTATGFYINFTQKQLPAFFFPNTLKAGLKAQISKAIPLDRRMQMEPALAYYLVPGSGRSYLGLAVAFSGKF